MLRAKAELVYPTDPTLFVEAGALPVIDTEHFVVESSSRGRAYSKRKRSRFPVRLHGVVDLAGMDVVKIRRSRRQAGMSQHPLDDIRRCRREDRLDHQAQAILWFVSGAESHAAHEREHLLEVGATVEMQHVVARKPMQAAVIPMLPQHATLLRRCKTVAEAADDHPPLGC